MKRFLLLLSASALVLGACAKPSDAPPTPPNGAPVAADAAASNSAAMASDAATTGATTAPSQASGASASNSTPPATAPAAQAQLTPMLAYSYDYGITAPAANIRALVSKEEAVCQAAGAAACEITGVNINETAPDAVTGQVTLKATPAWLNGFEQRLASDTQAGGGRLDKTEISTEDLSRQIVDTQAAVAAKTALRDRLQQMLQTQNANLQDLLAVEDKLADVQGDLDATNSELATMKERVATSDVTIDYASTGVLAPQGAWAPLGSAVGGATGVLATSLAAIVYLVAFVLPWAAIVGGLIWVFRKRIFRPGKPAARPLVRAPPDPPSPSSPGVSPGDPSGGLSG